MQHFSLSPSCTLLPTVLAALALGSALYSHPSTAGIVPTSTSKPTPNTLYYRVDGLITKGDAAKMERMLKEKMSTPGKMTVWAHMDSRGGDLDEAMKLGRVFRKYKVYTTHGQCVGSCAYAYMGGAMRYYTPPRPHVEMSTLPQDMTGIWVFEPYVMAKVQPLAATNPAIAAALNNIQKYVVEMTGKPNFYNSVTKIPHTKPVRMSQNNMFDMNVGSLEASSGPAKQSMPMGEQVPAW